MDACAHQSITCAGRVVGYEQGQPSLQQGLFLELRYMEDFLNDYHSYLLWVKKERERWIRMERWARNKTLPVVKAGVTERAGICSKNPASRGSAWARTVPRLGETLLCFLHL